NDKVRPATFGGCSDYPATASDPATNCVNLLAMGANPNKQDIFVEMDWLRHNGNASIRPHVHLPKYAAIKMVGDAFATRGIALHADVGPNYPGMQYVVPASYARGEPIDEDSNTYSLLCPNPLLGSKFP